MLAYEGASSLSVQSHLASEIFRDLVKGNPLDSSAPDISIDYSQLDKALNRNDPQSLLYDKSFPETKHQEKSQGNIVMPPLTDIVLLLKWTKGDCIYTVDLVVSLTQCRPHAADFVVLSSPCLYL